MNIKTIEEKAKAYDEALNWMRELYPGLHGATKEDAEHYFPELRESEDERIRNEIIAFIKQALHSGGGISVPKEKEDRWLAYLKKKKDHFRDDTKMVEKQDYSGLTDLERAIHRGFLSAGVENVPVTIIKETAKECLAQMKPAEWSEEDEKMLQRIIRHTESEYQDWCNDKYGNSEIVSDGKRSCLERLDWLEKRLKSLRPQHHWKPSKEQMGALKKVAYNLVGTGTETDVYLVQLYEQLKNL